MPRIEQFANLSDKQLQKLLHSNRSFYEIFDIYNKKNSLLLRKFAHLANSQEKTCIGLGLKSVKMGSELMRSLQYDVLDIQGLHWWGVGFDLAWLWLVFDAINATVDLPLDNQSLDESHFFLYSMIFTSIVATLQAFITYESSGESTNLTFMLMTLTFLPLILRSIFSGYGKLQEENCLEIADMPYDLESENNNDNLTHQTQSNITTSLSSHLSSLFKRGAINNKEDFRDHTVQNTRTNSRCHL